MSTDGRVQLGDMPDWPRYLSEEQAAAYLGVSVTTFRARIGKPWPQPLRMGRRKLYDRAAIDRVADRLSEPAEEDPGEAIRRARKRHAH